MEREKVIELARNLGWEYDEEEGHIEEKGKNKYIIEGMTPLEELEKRFQISYRIQWEKVQMVRIYSQ